MAQLLLRISVVTILLGRGYQHLFWDGPYRNILWDESWGMPLFKLMGWSWASYAQSSTTDFWVGVFTQVLGVLFVVTAGAVVLGRSERWSKKLLQLSGAMLAIMVFALYKEKHYQWPMLVEHALQVGMPIFLSYRIKSKLNTSDILLLKSMIALTFIGHGSYALGVHFPVPGEFLDMTMEILGVSEPAAVNLMRLAGLWDYAIGLLIFIPAARNKALIFAAGWGLSTALARVLSFVSFENFWIDSHSWIFETVYRLCHGLVPLALYLILQPGKTAVGPESSSGKEHSDLVYN